jgi:hypothetical protein
LAFGDAGGLRERDAQLARPLPLIRAGVWPEQKLLMGMYSAAAA